MIITVTLNPAIDKTMTTDNFCPGNVNRVSSVRYDIGGKGVNVSKVLKNFSVDSICTGFLGGMWEKYFIDELNKRQIESKFIKIQGNTRTNIKIADTVNNIYTDINETGPYISKEELDLLLNEFDQICNKGDIVILSGGVSYNVPKNIYASMTSIAKKKGAVTILDADGELLKEGIKANPDIIKPNNNEIKDLMNLDDDSDESLIKAAQKLIKQGIRKVLISLGAKGALYVTENCVYKAEGIKVAVKSTVGAGDSMVAAIVYSIINEFDDATALKYAVSSGTVSVTLEGTQACSLYDVTDMLETIKIMEVK